MWILGLALLASPALCYGVRASAERLCKERYPDLSPEARVDKIKIPTRALVRGLGLALFVYALGLRALGRASLGAEFLYVGATASADVFYAWEDEDVKPQWERVGAAAFVFASGVYVWSDDASLRFAVVYALFSSFWKSLGDWEAWGLPSHARVRLGLRAAEVAALGGVLGVSTYRSGTLDPMLLLLNAMLVRGCERAWYA